ALVKPDGTSISFQFVPGYPRQVSDISFGVDPAGCRTVPLSHGTNAAPPNSTVAKDHLRYFTTPTPGASNKEGLPGLAASPRFSKPSGVYTKSLLVELSATSSGATIRYTLDDSEPNTTSTAYASPIEISATAVLKARTFEHGLAPSATVAQSYTMADESMAAF